MRTRATLAAASLAVGVLALGTPMASAAQSTAADSAALKGCSVHWQLGHQGEACYHDVGNEARVNDQKGNGRSVVLVVSKKGGGNRKCWDHKGHEGSGTTCDINKWKENAHVRGRLCPGQWAETPSNRVIGWKHCTKYKKFLI